MWLERYFSGVLLRRAQIRYFKVLDVSGAYYSAMSKNNYNRLYKAPEVIVDGDGNVHVIRERKDIDNTWENKRDTPDSIFGGYEYRWRGEGENGEGYISGKIPLPPMLYEI